MSTADSPATAAAGVRVLARPASTPATGNALNPPADGVVTVGFVGTVRNNGGLARLADRLLDARVFGSGGAAKSFHAPLQGVAYHHDAEKKIVFLLFSPGIKDDELRGLLFMFSVCHVIIFVHDRARFDPGILKKLRLLQTSKIALAPYVRKQLGLPKAPTPAVSRPVSMSSPVRRSSGSTRVALMLGTSSHQSVLPGQCSPVVLFVFEADFCESVSSADGNEHPSEVSHGIDGLPKLMSAKKSTGPMVMLARPSSKSDSSLKKKLQSSIEAQIRFLIKKCRILAGAEQIGPRGAHSATHQPLFSLDASRTVVLLDGAFYQKGEPLDIISGLIENALGSDALLDLVSPEITSHSVVNEDIQHIKDFIFRHVDALRGRGSLSGTASTSGAGMVAVAAAAAAASASAGKPVAAPSLLKFDEWLSISTTILSVLLSEHSADGIAIHSIDRSPSQGNRNTKGQLNLPEGENAVKAALSCLDSGKALNKKFSISWCQRALPVAKEVYMKDLPASYPTKLHKCQVEKALNLFRSMVKGVAVQEYLKKLEEECQLIWESGRQQCDSVSLTGKPCMHSRHVIPPVHSSGYEFLHACACGQLQQLRDDPFDFESANLTFNCFHGCEDLLPTLEIPRDRSEYSLPIMTWQLIRLGGSKDYNSLEGVLQSGFDSAMKYLLRWTVSFGQQSKMLSSGDSSMKPALATVSDSISSLPADGERKNVASQIVKEAELSNYESERKQAEVEVRKHPSISFGKGFPAVPMKKAFAEVVAGTSMKDSEFPALQPKKPLKIVSRRDEKPMTIVTRTYTEQVVADVNQVLQSEIAPKEESKPWKKTDKEHKPFLQIGSNIVPFDVNAEANSAVSSPQQFDVYIGFEHECPHGHRFLLSDDHLKELGDKLLPQSMSRLSINNGEGNTINGAILHENHSQNVYESTMHTIPNNAKKDNESSKPSKTHYRELDKVSSDKLWADHDSFGVNGNDDNKRAEECLHHLIVDKGGEVSSLLNRNLPLYMLCPYCRKDDKQGYQNTTFASTVSQLQRIFVVTPDFPILLATCPVVQFQDFCLPESAVNRELQSRFSLGCRVNLPPDSFLAIRLPFVYGIKASDGSIHPIKYSEQNPECTAWLVSGTTLQIASVGDFFKK